VTPYKLRPDLPVSAGVRNEFKRLNAEVARLTAERDAWKEKTIETESELAELAEAALSVVAGIDQWNEDIQKIIGRYPDYHWGNLERLRSVLRDSAGEP